MFKSPFFTLALALFVALAASHCAGDSAHTAAAQQNLEPLLLSQDGSIGHSGYRNAAGEWVVPAGKYAGCLTDTFRTHAIVITRQHQFVVIDRQEKVLYEVFPFDNGPDYAAEGLFRIIQGGKIGYADAATYAVVIAPRFDCAYPFEHGAAQVSNACQKTTDGDHSIWTAAQWTYINKKGEEVSPPAAKQ